MTRRRRPHARPSCGPSLQLRRERPRDAGRGARAEPVAGAASRRRRGRRRRRPGARSDGARGRRPASRCRRAASRGADAAAVPAPRPSPCRPGRERRSFSEVGIAGWLRDRLDDLPHRAPIRERVAPRRGRRAARPARRVAPARAVLRDPGPAHVPPGRARPDALRRGLPRADRDRVPAGLALRRWTTTSTSGPTRTWPSTRWPAGSSLWGEDDVSATSELGVPVRAAAHRAAPRGRAARRPGRRAGPRRDRERDPDLRPAHARARRDRAARPGVGALAVDRPASSSSPAPTTARSSTLELIALGLGDGRRRHRARSRWRTRRPPDRAPARDRRRGDHRGRLGRHGLTPSTPPTAGSSARRPLDGIADLAPGRHGSTLVADPADDRRPGGRRGRPRRAARTATPPTTRRALAGRRRRRRRSASAAPGDGETRDRVQAAIDDGRLAGLSIVDLPRVAVATVGGRDLPRPGQRAVVVDHRARRRRARPGPRHRHRRPEAVRHHRRRRARPGLRVVAGRRRQRRGRPGRSGRQPLPGPGTWVAYDDASQHGPRPGPGRRARPGPRRTPGRSTSSSRTATRAVFADAAAAGRPRAGGLGHSTSSRST